MPDGTWPGNPQGNDTSDGVLAFWTPSLRTLTFNAKAPWYIGNSNNPAVSPNMFDFWAVALHEWGHVIGLKHPDNAVNFTTMYPSISQRGVMTMAQINLTRGIDADTLDGARGLYTIPTPGTLGLLAFAGIVATRRRRT
jgi:MYXO-CTERM domain-containing protein